MALQNFWTIDSCEKTPQTKYRKRWGMICIFCGGALCARSCYKENLAQPGGMQVLGAYSTTLLSPTPGGIPLKTHTPKWDEGNKHRIKRETSPQFFKMTPIPSLETNLKDSTVMNWWVGDYFCVPFRDPFWETSVLRGYSLVLRVAVVVSTSKPQPQVCINRGKKMIKGGFQWLPNNGTSLWCKLPIPFPYISVGTVKTAVVWVPSFWGFSGRPMSATSGINRINGSFTLQ